MDKKGSREQQREILLYLIISDSRTKKAWYEGKVSSRMLIEQIVLTSCTTKSTRSA